MTQRAEELEPELEELLNRIVPELTTRWQGATEDEIAQIEQIAGRPLPSCYQWFLLRMGHSMGPISYHSLDFSAQRLLSCYRDGLVVPHPRFLMIASGSDDAGSTNRFYDLEHPARGDARVVVMVRFDTDVASRFETLREMIAWGEFLSHRVQTFANVCSGVLTDIDADVLSKLGPMMESLGFAAPIPTGGHCALYDSADAAIVSRSTPGNEPEFHHFSLGGQNPGSLRRILGAIRDETSLELEVSEWNPPVA